MPPLPLSAASHYRWSAALVQRAVREARRARSGGLTTVGAVLTTHQAAAAFQAQPAVAAMLAEQHVNRPAAALLNTGSFTTDRGQFAQMLEQIEFDWQFDRLIASLVQDAGRAAEQVATTVRPGTGYVRYLSPPSCSRCAVLSGRVYRYSTGFSRHPGCDCTMVPTAEGDDSLVHDPVHLARQGLISDLSKADGKALANGADLGQLVNVRRQAAGLNTPGRVLVRGDRPTPEGIFRAATSRDDAIARLIAAGYVR